MEISQNFVTFSEYMNFSWIRKTLHHGQTIHPKDDFVKDSFHCSMGMGLFSYLMKAARGHKHTSEAKKAWRSWFIEWWFFYQKLLNYLRKLFVVHIWATTYPRVRELRSSTSVTRGRIAAYILTKLRISEKKPPIPEPMHTFFYALKKIKWSVFSSHYCNMVNN